MKKTKLILMLMTIFVMAFALNVYAAKGSFKLSKTSVTLKEGKTTTFDINPTNCEGKFSVTSSDTSIVKVSSASVWAPGDDDTITITALKAGTAKITVTAINVGDTDENDVTGSQTISVTVESEKTSNEGGSENQNTNTGSNNGTTNNTTGGNNITNTNTNTGSNSGTIDTPKTKSTNAYLSTLGVRLSEADATALGVNTGAYDFKGFKKSTLTYSVTVPYEVDSLKVSYKAAHSGATVKVTGNTGLEVGTGNKITIKVTAEDGKTTKTYTIRVTKLAEELEKPGNIIDEEIEELYLTSLSIKGIEISPEFSKDVYAYTAKLEKNDVTEVEVNAVANKENAIIEISGNTNLVIGENTINVVVKHEGSTLQTVYQIALTKEVTLVTTTGEETDFMSNLISNIKNYVIIAIVVVVLIIAAIVILIILLRKENKKINEQETEEEYNVYENDENEFENNKEKIEQTMEDVEKETQVEEITNETETKNERRTRRKEKGRHSK